MTPYIDKSALVVEIKKRLKHNGISAELDRSAFMAGREKEDEDILALLDTFEVKEAESESLDEKAIAKYLHEKKGYPISLNGNLPSFEETMKDAKQYMIYNKEQFIKKAAIWFNDYFASHDDYGVISPLFDNKEEMFEDFKKYMNR